MDHLDRSKGFNLFLRTSIGQMSTKLYNSHFRKYCIAEASIGHGANHSKKRVHVFRFESCDGYVWHERITLKCKVAYQATKLSHEYLVHRAYCPFGIMHFEIYDVGKIRDSVKDHHRCFEETKLSLDKVKNNR